MSKHTNPAEQFFVRYNFVLQFVLAAIALIAAIYLCYSAYLAASSPDMTNVKSSIPTNFDKPTSQKIDQLHDSDNPNISVTRPAGRINPFAE